MRLARHVARIGEMINAYKIVARKPEGKRLISRS
jgi:nitrogen fixation/metabolism regulation signal transduction histidine kinase